MPTLPKLPRKLLFSLLVVAAAGVPAAASAGDATVSVVDDQGRPVAGAVVTFRGDGRPAKVTPGVFEILQEGQQFMPELTVVPVGSRVRFPNRDEVAHHVYSFSPAKKFDLPLYQGEAPRDIVFDRAGVVALGCNIHDWMVAHVFVTDTPFFAVTGHDGRAALRGIGNGKGVVEVWHPRQKGDAVSRRVDGLQDVAPVVLKLRPDFRRRHAPAAGGEGGSYR
jgi:plastocyanin